VRETSAGGLPGAESIGLNNDEIGTAVAVCVVSPLKPRLCAKVKESAHLIAAFSVPDERHCAVAVARNEGRSGAGLGTPECAESEAMHGLRPNGRISTRRGENHGQCGLALCRGCRRQRQAIRPH
jgi:hypothetical protein